jgi:rare lipoprotein A
MRSAASRISPLLAAVLAGCAGPRMVADTPVKLGRPYQVAGQTYVPADDRTYDAIGIASYYGPEQRGRTANGESFDGRHGGAAHKTLPLPSYVEVTALASGKRIIVRVNDRGPFVAGRIIDLSQPAARLLGIVGAGTAKVRVRRVFPDEATRRALRSGQAAALLSPVARGDGQGYQSANQSPDQRTSPPS